MTDITRTLYYSAVKKIILMYVLAILMPISVIEGTVFFLPDSFPHLLNLFLLIWSGLGIIGVAMYAIWHHQTLCLQLAPVTKLAEIGEISARVAHDLRGPLSGIQSANRALQKAHQNGAHIEGEINLLELSSRRLEEIIQNVLGKYSGVVETHQRIDLHELLDQLIGEYQAQDMYGRVQFIKDSVSDRTYINGHAATIRRMISNLLRNACEAMNYTGTITTTTTTTTTQTQVTICDTGHGMSPATVRKLMAGNFTHGKADGHGIGFSYVKDVVAQYHGTLHIESTPAHGTSIRIAFPSPAQPTEPFVIATSRQSPVLVIDDDPVLLEQWRRHFDEAQCPVYLANCYEDCERYGEALSAVHTAIVDYHFDNSTWTGGEVVRMLRQRNITHCILCTAEYWKPSVQQLAKELDVVLCPKPLPPITIKRDAQLPAADTTPTPPPAQTDGVSRPTTLVLDDDDGIRLAWTIERERLGIGELTIFGSMEECESAGVDYSKYDLAFVDKNIPDSTWRVDRTIAHLKARGVKRVLVASGESKRQLTTDPLCAMADGVVLGKMPLSLDQYVKPEQQHGGVS